MIAAVPCLVMLTITTWAMIANERKFVQDALAHPQEWPKWLLVAIAAGIFLLAAWMIFEAVIVSFKGRETDPAPGRQVQA